jgi:adenylate cyclase
MKRHVPLLLGLVALIASTVALLFGELRVGSTLERRSYDSWFRLRGPLERPSEIVIVTIDDESGQSLGRFPWKRDWHAKLIRNLARAGARVVAFDVTFADALPDEDAPLREAIEETGVAVLGAKTNAFIDPRASRLELEEPAADLGHPAIGLVDIRPDAVDAVIREYPMAEQYSDGRVVPQLGIQALIQYLGLPQDAFRRTETGWQLADRLIPSGPGGGMLVNFVGVPGYISHYSYVTVVDDAETDIGEWDLDTFEDYLRDDRFKDRIVLVGSTVPEHQDLHPTPFRDAGRASDAALLRPGVEIHANAIATILSNRFIHTLPRSVQYAWTLLLALLVAVAARRLRFVGGAFLTATLVGVAVGAAYYLFAYQGIWLWSVSPALATGLSYAGSAGVLYLAEEQEKSRLRGMFGQYVSPSVVDQLMLRPDAVQLGGEERVATVLFSDIVGFSTVSEYLSPTQLVSLLNEYLTEMTEVVLENGGIIDKYQGDSIMAEFGVPVPVEDHAKRACTAALRMSEVLSSLRERWAREGKPLFRACFGINTGPMLIGNLGSRRVMDYTVMGDHVNLASRLEGTNRLYGTTILVSEFTWKATQGAFIGREVDRIRVKGKQGAVSIYEVIDSWERGFPAQTRELVEGYKASMELYRAGDFDAALTAFEKLGTRFPTDGPTRVLTNRCRQYLMEPPPEDWGGVYVMTVK